MNLFPQPLCPCRAGPFLQTGFQLSNTCSFAGSKQILQGLLWCPFIHISAIPKGCLGLSASPGCRGRTQHVNLSALLQQRLLRRLWERAACPVPQRHLVLGSQGPGQPFPPLSYSLLEELVAGRELLHFKQVNNEKPLEDWGGGQSHLILVLKTGTKI